MRTLIFRTASSLLVPLSLIFAVFIFFKGHQTPGGGFVAGLVASVALIVYRMSYGRERAIRLLPMKERTLIALGLTFALGTGALALLSGLPFLTSNNGYLPLPGGEPYHWATVMFFDIGVFLTVTGTVVGMINALGDQLP